MDGARRARAEAYCYRCPLNLELPKCKLACVNLAWQAIARGTNGLPVALFMEPIQGNGDMINFPPDYYPTIRKMCDGLGMLLIFDEIQTGFGRCGTWFAEELYNTVPDIMTIGKGIGGDFPLFGFLAREDLTPFSPGDHSFTFAHFPVVMTAALATIQVIGEKNLLERARTLGEHATTRLKEMEYNYELIGGVRGLGLMIGIELVKDRKTKTPAREEAHEFIKMGIQRGVIYGQSKYSGLGNIVRIKPPLVTTEAQLDRALDVFEEIVQRLSDE